MVTVNKLAHSSAPTLDYFQLGQLSRFVDPGAVRVASDHFVRYRYLNREPTSPRRGLTMWRFSTPDGSKVLLVYNDSKVAGAFALESRGHTLTEEIAPKMTETLIWDRPR